MKIGVDLGGTNMRVGLVDGDRIVSKSIIPCPAKADKMTVVDTLADLIAASFTFTDSRGMEVKPEIEGIGVGVPTLVDAATGTVYNATNIPSWDVVPLKQLLRKRFDMPVEINNDANCFALGEKRFGIGRDLDSLVGVTLGTGVGGGLILDGKLYCGRNTGAGEIGELPYLDRNFEYYCSSNFFISQHSTTGHEAASAARQGDSGAVAIWREFGSHVGNLMKALLFAYDPDAIVIGGGISSAFELFGESMMARLADFNYPGTLTSLKIVPSRLPDVAILGASALV